MRFRNANDYHIWLCCTCGTLRNLLVSNCTTKLRTSFFLYVSVTGANVPQVPQVPHVRQTRDTQEGETNAV